jgi:hypothetical protein
MDYTQEFIPGHEMPVRYDAASPATSILPHAVWFYFAIDLLEGILFLIFSVVFFLMFAVGKAGA